MIKSTLIGSAIALCVALIGLADTASAAKAKRLTYEQAWADCKKDVAFLPGVGDASRYTRGAACMKQHGYRLKKSSM